MCVFRLRMGLTDLNAGCRAVGLCQRRGLGSHARGSEAGVQKEGGGE